MWNSLKKLNNEQEADYISCISQQSWVDHFKKVRTADNDPSYPLDDINDGPLDYEISDEELDDASGVLKNWKKSGIDMICISNRHVGSTVTDKSRVIHQKNAKFCPSA